MKKKTVYFSIVYFIKMIENKCENYFPKKYRIKFNVNTDYMRFTNFYGTNETEEKTICAGSLYHG